MVLPIEWWVLASNWDTIIIRKERTPKRYDDCWYLIYDVIENIHWRVVSQVPFSNSRCRPNRWSRTKMRHVQMSSIKTWYNYFYSCRRTRCRPATNRNKKWGGFTGSGYWRKLPNPTQNSALRSLCYSTSFERYDDDDLGEKNIPSSMMYDIWEETTRSLLDEDVYPVGFTISYDRATIALWC